MVCFHPCLTQGSVGPSESLVPIHIIPNYWTPMKSPCPMNQFRIITSSVFTLQFREMKSLRKKTKSAMNHTSIIHINHIKPQAKTAQTLHIAQSEPSPHHLSDRCLSPAHAWSPASRSRWDLVHPWRRSSGWWGRSRCPCWNLGSPMASTWLRHSFDLASTQVKAKAMTILLKQLLH